MLRATMERARAVDGLGWVDAASGRFALPRTTSERLGPAPREALPLELAIDGRGMLAIVRGPSLDVAQRARIRECLAEVASDVVFLVASERGAYVVDADANVRRAAHALAAIQEERGEEHDAIVVFAGNRACVLRAGDVVAQEITRERAPVEDAYARAETVALLRADVDRLMVYNDWLGHVEGDLLLARVLAMACSLDAVTGGGTTVSIHRRDVLLVLPGADAARATDTSEALLAAMRRARVQLRHPEVKNVPYLTLSVGAVSIESSMKTSLDRALEELDLVVQEAKLAGRNRARLSRIEG